MEDMIVAYLKKLGIKVDRKTYVTLNSMGDQDGSEMLPAEEEAELPESLQHSDFREEE